MPFIPITSDRLIEKHVLLRSPDGNKVWLEKLNYVLDEYYIDCPALDGSGIIEIPFSKNVLIDNKWEVLIYEYKM